MLILSITENGEESLIFLVMTIFGECIQLKCSPNYTRDSHLGSNAVFSNEILHCSTYVSTGLNGFDGLVQEVMALVYSETVVHSSIFFSGYRTMRNYLD